MAGLVFVPVPGWAGPVLLHAARRRLAEHAAGVVAAPLVATVWAEEHVVPAAAMLAGAGAPPPGMVLGLERDQVPQEPGKVDGQLRLPLRAAVGVIFRREPVHARRRRPARRTPRRSGRTPPFGDACRAGGQE